MAGFAAADVSAADFAAAFLPLVFVAAEVGADFFRRRSKSLASSSTFFLAFLSTFFAARFASASASSARLRASVAVF